MKTAGAVALALLAALAVPASQAQAPEGLVLTLTPPADDIPYAGTATLQADVRVGCASILAAMSSGNGAAVLTVAPASPPTWLTASEATADLAAAGTPQACLSGAEPGYMVQHFDIDLSVTKDAPGVVDNVVDFTATLGEAGAAAPVTLVVAYHVNYTIVADATFPLTVDGPEVSFNVTVTQASNARSMVMVEKVGSSAGVLSGMGSQVYENAAGAPASKTFKVTFKAPAGEWGNATASFTGYSHYLLPDGRAGEFGDPCAGLAFPRCDAEGTPVTYSFVAGHSGHEHDEDKDAPAPVGALLALGLVGLAALARRRA